MNCKKSILIIHKYTSYIYTYIHKCLANKSTDIDHLFIYMYVGRPRSKSNETLEIRHQRSVNRDQKSEIRNRKSEIRDEQKWAKEKRVGTKQMLNETTI